MTAIVKLLANRPLIVGNVVKAVIALGAIFGVAATDAAAEAVVGVVVSVLALVAAITAKEQAVVTPVEKAATMIDKPVELVSDLLKKIKL